MNNTLHNQLRSVCTALNKHAVEYLVVGGSAMALYDAYRGTTKPSGEPTNKHDFDFWYNPTYKNYYNLLRALTELGLDVKKHWDEQEPNPRKSFFKFENDHFTLDFLPEILGLTSFETSYKKKQTRRINEVRLYVIGRKDLYASKEAVGRQKDKDDIAFMRTKGV